MEKYQLCRETNTFPVIFSFIDRNFAIFRKEMDGPNPLAIYIEVILPALTYC